MVILNVPTKKLNYLFLNTKIFIIYCHLQNITELKHIDASHLCTLSYYPARIF
jgi:hypothetical protein